MKHREVPVDEWVEILPIARFALLAIGVRPVPPKRKGTTRKKKTGRGR